METKFEVNQNENPTEIDPLVNFKN